MRLASVLAYLALAVICLFFDFHLSEAADLPFAAGAPSLSANAAWIGLIAFAFQVWFLSHLVEFVLAAFKTLRPTLLKNQFTGLSYRATSYHQLWEPCRSWIWGVLAALMIFQLGLNLALMAGMAVHALMLSLERFKCKGKALWHGWPGFFAGIATLLVLLVSLMLMRCAGLRHALQFARALFGQGDLSETTVLLNAQLFTDFNVLLLLASTAIIFALPPLSILVEMAGRWKRIPAAIVLLAFALCITLSSVRTRVQGWMVNGLGEGGNRVVPGTDGWLFDQRELRALTGAGPLEPDLGEGGAPHSKAKDEIIAFAHALKERGIPLLLIPVPMKASLYPEALTRSDPDDSEAPLYHASQPAIYEQLAKEGIDVQDITNALMQLKKRHEEVFFKQDSHWTPEAMQEIARAVAVHVRRKYPGTIPNNPLIADARAPEAASYGDLAERLYPLPGLVLDEESKILVSFPTIENDPQSPICLLGGDDVRIFDDPDLGYVSTTGIHASFAQHLALYCGERIDVFSSNSGATSAVRKAFASRFDDVVKAKKLVIWLVPARDLMLPGGAGVDWSSTPFNPQTSPAEVLTPMVPGR